MLKNDFGFKGAFEQRDGGVQEIAEEKVELLIRQQVLNSGSKIGQAALCEKVGQGAELVGHELLVESGRVLLGFLPEYWGVALENALHFANGGSVGNWLGKRNSMNGRAFCKARKDIPGTHFSAGVGGEQRLP